MVASINKIEEIKTKANLLEEPLKSIILDILELFEISKQEMDFSGELSPYNFVKEKKLENHMDKVIGLAYYLFKYRKMDSFTVKDIEKIYGEARLAPPKNFSDLIKKAAKKGYFIETKEKLDGAKIWKISASGIKYIEEFTWVI
ncbi:MAG: hypothetical protein RMH75_07410 [Archaeoglobaceae archaeon]|nr:hypothetical protein [Leptospiraceae bacterium]MDW7990467.1 hypothetical protein [Archaeoglobaceae archaeon]